jgi:hypothetical protein
MTQSTPARNLPCPTDNLSSIGRLSIQQIAHPDDIAAFEVLADRAYAHPHPQWYQPKDIERFSELLERERSNKSEF